MSKPRVLLALLVTATLFGCGGGGGGSARTTPVSFTLSWAERSRAIQGPSSALSARIVLTGAVSGGGDYAVIVDRHANLAAYTETYTPSAKAKVGTFPLTVRFYSQPNGGGEVIGVATATVTISSTGGGIGTITTSNTVQTVTVDANQIVLVGAVETPTFSARDGDGALVAVSAGSASWTQVSGSDVGTIVQSGDLTGIKPGTVTVQVSVDGVTSGDGTVKVQNDPDGALTVLNFDELTAVSAIAGTTVTSGAQLSNQYLTQYGVSFSSAAGYAAVVNVGSNAPSSPNGLTAAATGDVIDYNRNNPIEIIFHDPANLAQPGVTKTVSVTGDLDGRADLNGLFEAYDVDGNKIDQILVSDAGGEVYTLSTPTTAQIHRVLFRGNPNPNQDGIAIDNLKFGPIVPAP
jgi:hypothetical protein